MQIIDKFRGLESLDDQGITRVFPNGETKTIPQNVACEHHMDVTINTIPTFRIVCSPDHLPELVIGRLYSEGIIQGTDEVEQVYVCDLGNRCEVILKDKERADFSRNEIAEIPTCCTGNQTLNAYFSNNELPEPVTPIEWDKEWIFKMCEYFKVDSPAHKKSYGTHSCYITQKGDFEVGKNPIMCEDLGRHNAFDKALGCALIAGYDIKNSLVYTSGRLPIDMIVKAVRAKVPILCSKAVPTDAGIDLATASKLTLICSAYPDSFDVYCSF